MTHEQQHAAVLAGLAQLEQLAQAAQPGGAWYREGRDVNAQMPLLSPEEMEDLHPEKFEDWVFTAATTADAQYITTLHPRATLAMLAGRRRILERHKPYDCGPADKWTDQFRCVMCSDRRWPCDDYRDAAADLLPEGPTP